MAVHLLRQVEYMTHFLHHRKLITFPKYMCGTHFLLPKLGSQVGQKTTPPGAAQLADFGADLVRRMPVALKGPSRNQPVFLLPLTTMRGLSSSFPALHDHVSERICNAYFPPSQLAPFLWRSSLLFRLQPIGGGAWAAILKYVQLVGK